MRLQVSTQAQFKKIKPPKNYHYDSSISPALQWDAKNSAREQGALLRQVLDAKSLNGAKFVASKLNRLSKPFLNRSGKAERLSFDVPMLRLFIHESVE